MRVAEVMERVDAMVVAEDSIQIAAQAMADTDSDAVLVGSREQLDGVLLSRDILIRVTAKGLDPAMTPVREIMSPAVETCREQEMAETVASRMVKLGIGVMPVVDSAGYPVGMVARRAAEIGRVPDRFRS